MQGLVEYLVKAIVENPDAVTVTTVNQGQMTVYEVAVADDDIGRVIGRHGRTAEALRTVLKTANRNQQGEVTIEILS